MRVAEKNELPSANLGSIQRLESQILFEDDAMIVLNKPSGMAVHGGSGLSFGVIEGCAPCARRPVSWSWYTGSIATPPACCWSPEAQCPAQPARATAGQDHAQAVPGAGAWPVATPRQGGQCAAAQERSQSGERVVRVSSDGKPSETRFRIARQFAEATLVECSPITGRTHQIRVHTQHAGHPIACDDKYGEATFDEKMRGRGLKRLFLHAWKLTFTHPVDDRGDAGGGAAVAGARSVPRQAATLTHE